MSGNHHANNATIYHVLIPVNNHQQDCSDVAVYSWHVSHELCQREADAQSTVLNIYDRLISHSMREDSSLGNQNISHHFD